MKRKIVIIGTPYYITTLIDYFLKYEDDLLICVSEKHANISGKYFKSVNPSNIFYYDSIKSKSLYTIINQFSPDYLFSCILSDKIPNSIIDLPRHQAFNIHPSLLPKYRGPAPGFWALYHNENKSGITMHVLTQDWDSGDIVAQLPFDLHPQETIGTYTTKCIVFIPALMDDFFNKVDTKTLAYTQQIGGQYFGKVSPDYYKIDWTTPAHKVKAHIQAANPFYPCEAKIGKSIYTIREAETTSIPAQSPGSFLIENGQLFISASDYFLNITILHSLNEGFFSGKSFIKYIQSK